MTKNIINTKHQLYVSELAKRQAEFAAFQSQVNPHFLYNTLDCIRSIAISKDISEIGDIAASMVKIFRYSAKGTDFVRVEDELSCIEHYLRIMEIRHQGRFVVRRHIEQAALMALIPKMVLQPLVENALIHGVEKKRGKSEVAIRGFIEKDALVLEVEDDGKGISSADLDRIQHSLSTALEEKQADAPAEGTGSIGLINIHKRIILAYGADYGLDIRNEPDKGFLVRLRTPFRSADHTGRIVTPASSIP